jgi:Ca-activated chloride channel family protein
MIREFLSTLALFFSAPVAQACELALVLAVDVSGSVDSWEYRIQRDGLAEALRDPVVSEALVAARAEVLLLQWTGAGRQRVTVPWRTITDFEALDSFADDVAADRRVWRNFSTAIGEALEMSVAQFAAVPHCTRRVIDVSGDGSSNEGIAPSSMRMRLKAERVTVNALVIEGAEEDLTGYFWENVIYGEGAFVVTVNDFPDYPQRIRQKLGRETTKQTADLRR